MALEGLDTESLERALRRAAAKRDRPREAALGLALAAVHLTNDDRPAARRLYEAAYEACKLASDLAGAQEAATQLSQIFLQDAQGREAADWGERALELCPSAGDTDHARARLLHNLAVSHVQLEEPARALQRYDEALACWRDTPAEAPPEARCDCLLAKAQLLCRLGRSAEAVGVLLEAEAAGFGGRLKHEALQAELLGNALVATGRGDEAIEPFRRSSKAWAELERPADHCRATLALGEALVGSSAEGVAGDERFADGVSHFRSYAALCRASGDIDGMVFGGWLVAKAYEGRGQMREAAAAWDALGALVSQTGSSGRDHRRRAAEVEAQGPWPGPQERAAALVRAGKYCRDAQDAEGELWCLDQRLKLALDGHQHAAAAQALDEMGRCLGPDSEHALTILSHRAHQLARAGDEAGACLAASEALALVEGESDLSRALESILDAFG